MLSSGKCAWTGILFLLLTIGVVPVVQGQALYVGPPVTLPRSHGVCGTYSYEAFNATAGQVFTSSISANDSLNVYVMNATQYEAWQHQSFSGSCIAAESIGSQINVTSYVVTVNIPTTGTYYLILNNLSSSTTTAKVSANLT